MLLIKRAAALLFSLALIVSCGSPAMAATPQEGWFIAGEETVDGIDYWVIDNKLSMDPWLVEYQSQRLDLTFSGVDEGNATTIVNGTYDQVLMNYRFYQGYSDYSWRVDNDWILKIYPMAPSEDTDFPYRVIVYDRTLLPAVTYNRKEPGGAVTTEFSSPWSLQQSTPNAIPFKSTFVWETPRFEDSGFGVWHYYSLGDFSFPTIYGPQTYISGSDINDICITIFNDSSVTSQSKQTVMAKMAVQWLCPKDKSPSGMAVGDYWPKLRPIEVEMVDAMDEFRDRLLAESRIDAPGDITSTMDALSGHRNNAINSLDMGQDAYYDAWTPALSIIQPVLTFLFPFFGLSLVLLIFANKGVH